MPNSVTEYYRRQYISFPDRSAFFSQSPDFNNTLTWKEIWFIAQNTAKQMQNAGIRSNDRVGILSSSSVEWELTQISLFLAGGVVVGFDPHDNLSSYEFIIQKCGIGHIYVNGEELLDKILPLISKYNLKVQLITIDRFRSIPFTDELPTPDPEQIATVLFTSGTNFEPKGIEYTHKQIVLTVETVLASFPEIPAQSQTTCWLPLSNLFQRIINFCCVSIGGKIFFVEKPQEIMQHLRSTNPHVFIAVPRFYEKVYDGIISKISRSLFFKTIFFLASIPARRRSAKVRNNEAIRPVLNLSWFIADRLIFKKIRALFGKNILFAISGSAPLRREVLEFFHMIDILILEAYGTSENIIPIAANRVGSYKFGSVGIPMLKDSVFISAENEIYIKGPGLFKGYVGSAHETCFEGNYYKTGDLGHFDENGFLYIEGRKSEVFKTTTGKKIPSIEIDAIFKSIPYVDIALTLGENRKAPVVLITLEFQRLAQTMNTHIDDLWDLEDGNFITRVLERISKDLSVKNTDIPEKMRPVGFIILTRKFIFEQQEVTSNLKIRRRHIEKKLTPTLDKLFLEIDQSPKTHFWFLNSQDLQISGQTENKILFTPAARLLQLINLFLEVISTIVSYNLLKKSSSMLNRKLGQILRYRLGRLRGPLQKVGQMLSYMHEDLPEEFREEIRDLLRDSPSINPFLIRSIVESELKQPIASLFCEWRDAPIYTASVGQVHFARLLSGEAVAVKVLLPKMDQIAKADLFLLQLCVPIIERIWKNPSTNQHFDELKNLILKECDLRQEAEYYDIFHKLFANNPNIIIPEVKKDLCTSKVLVTSFIDGISLEQFLQNADQSRRLKIADTIWRFHCEAVNRFTIFNADPHPGNFLICGDKVAFLDFGFCKQWDPHFIDLWKKQTLSGCNGDEAGFIAATKAMGFYKPGDPDFVKNLMPVYRNVFYCPWIEDQEFKITHQYLKYYLKTIFEKIVLPGNVHIPANSLASTRLYFEVFAIMADLDVHYNYFRGTIPYIEGDTIAQPRSDRFINSRLAMIL